MEKFMSFPTRIHTVMLWSLIIDGLEYLQGVSDGETTALKLS